MKLKKLFLASIAVAAFTACSNETEFIDNTVDNGNQPSVEDASMQFSIAWPQASLSRSTWSEIGSPEETNFVDITLVLDYKNSRSIYTLNRSDFEKKDPNHMERIWLKNNLTVKAGENVDIYAFVNASNDLKGQLKSAPFNTLRINGNYIEGHGDLENPGGIAEANKFLMSGKQLNKTIVGGELNTVSVSVERVAAKLIGNGRDSVYFATNPSIATANGDTLKLKVLEFNITNLPQDTYVLDNDDTIISNFFNQYNPDPNTSWSDYCKGIDFFDSTLKYTYLTENKLENVEGAALLIYKVEARWGLKPAKTFYVDGSNKLYLSFEDLIKTYSHLEGSLNDSSSIQEFALEGIRKYEGGICYYKAPMGTIKRNNAYIVRVRSIADIGDPTPGETLPSTTIELTVDIKMWTVNGVDVDL